MRRSHRARSRFLLGVVMVTCGVAASEARAQDVAASRRVAPIGSLANPYANPALNPFLNPYMTNQNVDRQSLMMYYMAAQRESGGIGSGQLSGARPGPGGKTDRGRRSSIDSLGSTTASGGKAGKYFGRRADAPRAQDRYFSRSNPYFANNGR